MFFFPCFVCTPDQFGFALELLFSKLRDPFVILTQFGPLLHNKLVAGLKKVNNTSTFKHNINKYVNKIT